jgi:hypothetical protein
MTADRRPVVRAPEAAWQRLGVLLQLRRADLGYRRRPAFTREHHINIRLVTDIENNYRPNTFLTPTLHDIARAYEVTYDSLIAVLAGKEDALEPADEVPVRLPPMSRPRLAADFGRFIAIERRLRELAAQGVADPSGAQVFPGSPDDAKAWDGIGARMDLDDRAWLIADLQRRADGRASGTETEAHGRLLLLNNINNMYDSGCEGNKHRQGPRQARRHHRPRPLHGRPRAHHPPRQARRPDHPRPRLLRPSRHRHGPRVVPDQGSR